MRYRYSSDFLGVVLSARIAFSKRSWPYMTALAMPWLMASGQRAMSRMWQIAGRARHRSSYYRFLSEGKIRLEILWRCLFELIVRTFSLTKLVLVVDDTLCPKWGQGIFGTGSFFDHVARPRAGYIWGHNWVVLAVVVQMGSFCWVALPFWIGLYRSKKRCKPKEFRTRFQMVGQMLRSVRLWVPAMEILLLGDGAYNNDSMVSVLDELKIFFVSRLRQDARLRKAPPPRRKSQRGRPAKYGAWLPSLKLLASRHSAFRKATVHIYRRTLKLQVRIVDAFWPALGRKVRLVIVRDPKGRHHTAYLMSTNLTMTAEQIIEAFSMRWSIEQLFADAKIQMGLDSTEARTPRAVLCHAALTMAFITWVQVWHHLAHPSTAHRSFSRKLNSLRTVTIASTLFSSGPRTMPRRKNTAALANLFVAASAAA